VENFEVIPESPKAEDDLPLTPSRSIKSGATGQFETGMTVLFTAARRVLRVLSEQQAPSVS
jgi:hypothetical protein